MRFVSFIGPSGPSFGLLQARGVLDLGSRLGFADLSALLGEGVEVAEPWAHAAPDYGLGAISFLPVIPTPSKILCVGINYDAHRQETGRPKSEFPTIFTRFADTQIGHERPLVRPRVSVCFDYEGELAVIIGRGGRYIPASRALDHVAGYACYNDASVRDWQRHASQFTPGKNFPGTGGFGPALVTPDEVGDPQALRLTTRLNGEVMQDATTDQMIFSVRELIAYISSFTLLLPGDVICTGTPGGVGFMREPPVFMKAGDTVEVEISRVGVLRNAVTDDSLGPD
jgi:2-keto-4-pentenoate hydratase/2-oxohepta-3-ene-1,7-dioic acid hydratase in catechol pathway